MITRTVRDHRHSYAHAIHPRPLSPPSSCDHRWLRARLLRDTATVPSSYATNVNASPSYQQGLLHVICTCVISYDQETPYVWQSRKARNTTNMSVWLPGLAAWLPAGLAAGLCGCKNQ